MSKVGHTHPTTKGDGKHDTTRCHSESSIAEICEEFDFQDSNGHSSVAVNVFLDLFNASIKSRSEYSEVASEYSEAV